MATVTHDACDSLLLRLHVINKWFFLQVMGNYNRVSGCISCDWLPNWNYVAIQDIAF